MYATKITATNTQRVYLGFCGDTDVLVWVATMETE